MRRFMLLIIICVIFGMVSCRTETESSPVTSASDGKISSLQIAVDKAAVGDVIDLSDSKYNEIKDYKADINKALTIKGSAGKTDFDNAKLIVTADGVELSSVSNVSIQTQSYLKIQSSSLNNLTIMTDGGRSGASAADTKPNVELSSTTVAGALNIMIDSSVVVFSGSANKVAQISSDVSAVVYLEDGTSDNKIPAPTVTGDGEVIYIDKTAESEIRLIALTPYSGLKTVFRVGETFDLSELVMMGTYEADDDGTTVYRAGELSYRMKSTFTRLERITPEWEASAGGDDIISGDGICQKSGTVAVIVEKDSCRFEYDISIIDDSPSDTPPILNDLSVKAQPRKKNYLAGEKLDLSGLVVLAEYHIGNAVYQTVVTDYTTSPAVGSSLTVDIQSLIISFGGKSVNVDIEVKAAWTVRYIVDMTDDAKNFTKQVADSGLAVELTDVMKSGYSYLGWCTDRECYNNYDFGTPVTSDLTLYAKWLENANNFNITYRDAGDTKFSGQFAGTPGTDYPVTHHYGDETVLVSPSRFGYLFDGWFKSAECAGEAVTKIGAQEYTSSFTLYAKWKPNEYNITYCDAGGLDLSGDFSGDYPQKHLYGSETVLPVPSGIHGEFKGWHRTADCSDTAMTSIGGEDVSSDITLYAKWENGYCDADGNFVVNGVWCKKTSLMSLSKNDVTCDMSDGAFKTGRSRLTIPPYAIGKYEVTQQLYKAVMGTNPSTNTSALDTAKKEQNAELRPADSVSWYMAVGFCNELSKLMGYEPFYRIDGTDVACDWLSEGYRLPTECEWENAARGGVYGTTEPWTYTYSGSETSSEVAWYEGLANTTVEVGLLPPNTAGLYDMSGNVLEWCNELFHADVTSLDDVYGPDDDGHIATTERVIRGGSFSRSEVCTKVQWRHHETPTGTAAEFGFRIARSL